MKGVSGISQVAMYGFAGGMPALRTASAVANIATKTGTAVSSQMTAVGNSVMNFKPMSLVDDLVLYYPNSPPVRSSIGGLITSAHYNINFTKTGQIVSGFMEGQLPPGVTSRFMYPNDWAKIFGARAAKAGFDIFGGLY